MLTKLKNLISGIKDSLISSCSLIWEIIKTLVMSCIKVFTSFIGGIHFAVLDGLDRLEDGLEDVQYQADKTTKTISNTITGIFK